MEGVSKTRRAKCMKLRQSWKLNCQLLIGQNRSKTVFFYQLQIRLPASFTFNLQEAGQKLSD